MSKKIIIKQEPTWDEVDQAPGTNCEINDVDYNILVPRGATYESTFSVKVEDGIEMDNEEEEVQLQTDDNMAGEADIGDLHSVKWETEEDWKNEEDFGDDNQENASGISMISESLFCKEETTFEAFSRSTDLRPSRYACGITRWVKHYGETLEIN